MVAGAPKEVEILEQVERQRVLHFNREASAGLDEFGAVDVENHQLDQVLRVVVADFSVAAFDAGARETHAVRNLKPID